MKFEWNEKKNSENIKKHGISFDFAKKVFLDNNRILAKDLDHSTEKEIRYFCFGKVENEVITVRFTYRNETIRIFGAGYWRKGKKEYEKQS